MSEQDQDVTVDTSTEVEEATESNEESEQVDTLEQQEEATVPKTQYDQVFARAKAAEREVKALKNAVPPKITTDPQLSEELKLIARGLSDEVIEKAKIIAKGNGTTLTEALKDDMLIAFQAKEAEKKRREEAKLGASKGSGESQDDTLIKPEMTREEHQEAFKKVMG